MIDDSVLDARRQARHRGIQIDWPARWARGGTRRLEEDARKQLGGMRAGLRSVVWKWTAPW